MIFHHLMFLAKLLPRTQYRAVRQYASKTGARDKKREILEVSPDAVRCGNSWEATAHLQNQCQDFLLPLNDLISEKEQR